MIAENISLGIYGGYIVTKLMFHVLNDTLGEGKVRMVAKRISLRKKGEGRLEEVKSVNTKGKIDSKDWKYSIGYGNWLTFALTALVEWQE